MTEKIKWKATHTANWHKPVKVMAFPNPVEGNDWILVWENGLLQSITDEVLKEHYTPIPNTYTLTVEVTLEELEILHDTVPMPMTVFEAVRALLEAQ